MCTTSSFSIPLLMDICCYSVTKSCPTLCDPVNCSMPGSSVLHYIPEFRLMSIELVMSSSHFILCYLFSSCPQSSPASGSFPVSWLLTSGGQNIGASASGISPSNEYSELISLRIDWFDLLPVQWTLKSLL